MKRIVIGTLMCVLALGAQAKEPWAELERVVQAREKEASSMGLGALLFLDENSSSRLRVEDLTVLPKILDRIPLQINVAVSWGMSAQACEYAKGKVQAAYNAWFEHAANEIQAQHREQEFQDILPILQRSVPIMFNCVEDPDSPAPADVTVDFRIGLHQILLECGKRRMACVKHKHGKPMRAVVPAMAQELSKDLIEIALLHEIGHTLGLADAYEEGYKKNASEEYRSQQRETYSVMNNFYLKQDDADGLINIIDAWTIHMLKQRHPLMWRKYASARILQGWDSLHRDEKTAKPVDRYREGTSKTVRNFNKVRKLDSKIL